MARCATFPPLWNVLNGVSGEALLQLIKVKEDKATDEKRRKKIREKEEEEEQRCGHKHKKTMKWGNTSDWQMNRENVNQLFDKGSLTEELEQPVSDSLYDSSHNTQNIKGKDRVQVDLRLKEHKYRQVLSVNAAGCCTTRTDFVGPSSRDGQLCSLSIVSTTVVKQLAPGPRKELWHFSSQKADLVADQNAEIASTSVLTESCSLGGESQSKQLVRNWAAAPIQIEHPEFDVSFLGAMHLTYVMPALMICGMEDVLYSMS